MKHGGGESIQSSEIPLKVFLYVVKYEGEQFGC